MASTVRPRTPKVQRKGSAANLEWSKLWDWEAAKHLPPILRWLYRGQPDDPKMLEPWHPISTCLISYAAFFTVLTIAHYGILVTPWLTPIDRGACPPDEFPNVADCIASAHWRYNGSTGNVNEGEATRTAIAAFLAAYYVAILGGRILALGYQNIYEALWGCNIGLLIGAGGLWLNRPLWTSGMAFALAIDQILWYVDVVSWALTGKFVIGVAAYLQWEETHWFKKVTCGHHLWFTPLLCWALWHWPPSSYNCFPLASITMGLFIEFLLVACPRFFLPPFALWPVENDRILTPDERKNIRRDSRGRPLKLMYLNVNLSYSGWKDVKLLPTIFAPRWVPGSWWYLYLPYQNAVWAVVNALLCTPMLLFL